MTTWVLIIILNTSVVIEYNTKDACERGRDAWMAHSPSFKAYCIPGPGR